jgi:ABC-type Fe3+ transport system permease subunit
MGERVRPKPWQMVVVGAVGAAAIGFIVVMAAKLLRDGTGTGDPFDYFRALREGLSAAHTWHVVGWSALAGAAVTALVEVLVQLLGGRRR